MIIQIDTPAPTDTPPKNVDEWTKEVTELLLRMIRESKCHECQDGFDPGPLPCAACGLTAVIAPEPELFTELRGLFENSPWGRI